MNPKWERFHNSFLVRGFRVLGGVFFFMLYANYHHFIFLPFFLSTILFVWVMTFLIYTMALTLHSLYYIIKALINGDCIYRNSPVNITLSVWK
jgi:hypothetical protein